MGDVTKTPAEVLATAMDPKRNDARATTVRGFLVALLRLLWEYGESFSGKRPWGNSGWQYAVHDAVLGVNASSVDADRLILAAIDSLGAPKAPPLPAILAALPHLTGDELRRVAEAMPRVAGEWENRERWGSRTFIIGAVAGQRACDNDCADWAYYENAYQALDAYAAGWTPELPYEASTYVGTKPVVTWHPTARAAQAACDARLPAAGVALCGEVVSDAE